MYDAQTASGVLEAAVDDTHPPPHSCELVVTPPPPKKRARCLNCDVRVRFSAHRRACCWQADGNPHTRLPRSSMQGLRGSHQRVLYHSTAHPHMHGIYSVHLLRQHPSLGKAGFSMTMQRIWLSGVRHRLCFQTLPGWCDAMCAGGAACCEAP